MLKSMQEQYGKAKGKAVYYAVEAKQKALPKSDQRTAINKKGKK
jgi:hypothetical protein